jgi:hypothetical protein
MNPTLVLRVTCKTISVVLQHRYANPSTETHEKYATVVDG